MAKAINTANGTDKAMSQLASLLIAHLSESINVADLSAKLNVSTIAVYKWLTGAPISAPYAFVIVTKAADNIPQIKHKKQREQAQRLLISVSEYLLGKV